MDPLVSEKKISVSCAGSFSLRGRDLVVVGGNDQNFGGGSYRILLSGDRQERELEVVMELEQSGGGNCSQ